MIEKNNEKTIPILGILENSGKYQYFQFSLLCLSAALVMMANVNYVFVAGDVNYRCKIPECESPDQPFIPNWWPSEDIDRCTRPVLNLTLFGSTNTCTNQSFSQEVDKCTEWVYETNDTIVAELNLGCQLWKQNMVGTVHGIGMVIAMLVSGWMTDRFGRKMTVIVCTVGCFIGNLKLLATSYPMYVVFEFLESAVSGGALSSGSVLLIEISAKKHRMLAGVIFAYAVYTGEALYACLAMVAKSWKTLLLIIYSPCILFISFILLLKESPRWQILHGRVKDTKKTLYLMAKMNNVNINVQELEDIDDNKLKELFNLQNEEKREGFKEVFTSAEMIKRIAMGFISRFTVAFIYYSLLLSSVYLPGNKYTNFLLAAVASYPGELLSLYFMSKFGRKVPLMYGFIICGATSIAIDFIPVNYVWVKILIFLIGKMGIAACYTGIVTYTMELFPTSVRGSLLGLCTLAACAGNMLAPLVPTLTALSPLLPPIFYGCSTILTTGLLYLTPETSSLPLPDTIKQIENYNHVNKQAKPSINEVCSQVNFDSHI